MSRKLRAMVVVSWVVLLSIIFVLGYSLYGEHKWSSIYFHHMMRAEDELDLYRAKQAGGVTIENPLPK